MQVSSIKAKSDYLNAIPRTLHDVCRALGRDDAGGACAACALRDMCADQLLRATQRHLTVRDGPECRR